MKALAALFDLVPGWAYALAVAALCATLAVTTHQRDVSRVDAAQSKARLADTLASAERAARQAEKRIADIQADHAAQQQAKETEYAKRLASLEAARRSDAALTGSLRDTIAAYAASGRRPGDSDAVAYQRAGDRLKKLGALLGEGAALVVEGRGVVQRRDAEVGRLLEQIALDRAACSPAAVTRTD